MPLALSQLLQIADSAFPTGAFAYSSGLEALARAGRFPTWDALESYLDVHIRQAAAFDLTYVAAAFAAGQGTAACVPGSPAAEPHPSSRGTLTFHAVCEEWDATQWNKSLRTASLRQGRAFVEALIDAFSVPRGHPLHDLRSDVLLPDSILHFAPAFGYSLAILHASLRQAGELYVHGLLRDQVAAAVRLGIVGPRSAQALQARCALSAQPHLERLEAARPPVHPRDARRSAPLVETGQGGHGFLYSRLFQN